MAAKIVAARPLTTDKMVPKGAVKGVGVKWLEVNGPHLAYDGPTTCTVKLKAAKAAK